MKQFEIWWADLRDPAGRRPVLLLSRNNAYDYLSKFIAAEITSTVRHIASEVLIGEEEGLPKACVVNFDSLSARCFQTFADQSRRTTRTRAIHRSQTSSGCRIRLAGIN